MRGSTPFKTREKPKCDVVQQPLGQSPQSSQPGAGASRSRPVVSRHGSIAGVVPDMSDPWQADGPLVLSKHIIVPSTARAPLAVVMKNRSRNAIPKDLIESEPMPAAERLQIILRRVGSAAVKKTDRNSWWAPAGASHPRVISLIRSEPVRRAKSPRRY